MGVFSGKYPLRVLSAPGCLPHRPPDRYHYQLQNEDGEVLEKRETNCNFSWYAEFWNLKMGISTRNVGVIIAVILRSVILTIASPPTPHIVFVLVDDLGYNDVGYHSVGSKIETDNIDDLAASGVKLESYYVAPICTPTRSQFLTGRYLIHNGMQNRVIYAAERRCLPPGDTIANKLSDAGYATHLVGKWHLGFYKKECWPLEKGFQSFFGKLLGKGGHFSHKNTFKGSGRNGCGRDFVGKDLHDNETNVQPDYRGQHSTAIFTERAQTIIREHNPDQPLFMYLSYQAPHVPLEVPDEYTVHYRGKIANKNRRTYAGMVTMLDKAIGNLTHTLKEEGLWNDTVFIFSTDNGGLGKGQAGNNWPLRGAKGNYFEGGIRGVGFVASPLLSTNVHGTSNRDLIHVSDWYPTLVEGVANVTLDYAELDGVNMWEVISQGVPGDPEREIVFNINPKERKPSRINPKYDNHLSIFDVSIQASIRRGDLKLITGHQAITEWIAPIESRTLSNIRANDPANKAVWLYNITSDPHEKIDLSDSMVDEVYGLLGRLNEYYTSSKFVRPRVGRKDCNADPALHGGLWTNWR